MRAIRITLLSAFAFCLFLSASSHLFHPIRASSPVRYNIDAGRSRFMVKTGSGGLFSIFGHNHAIAVRDFQGEIEFVPEAIASSTLKMRVKAESLAVTDKVDEKERSEIERDMREQVLETAKYPEIVFSSDKVSANRISDGKYKVKIFGNLSLHNVKRPIAVDARVSVVGDELKAEGEFSLKQTDYKIKPPSAGGGTVKVKDEVTLSFEFVAHKTS